MEFSEKISLEKKKELSSERKSEISKKFQETVGVLSKEDIADLDSLPIKEVFNLLSTWKKAALHNLQRFPREEAVDFVLELSEQEEFASLSDQKTIEWILEDFLHHPETFNKTVEILKKKRDPRVILETEKGTIEMADNLDTVDRICLMDSKMEKNKNFIEKCLQKGGVFILNDKDNDLVCFAIANQMPNYILYIDYISTDINKRKQGYGEEMLKYLIDKHAILEADLLRGNLLSKNVLERLGFKKDKEGERWVYHRSKK